MDEWRNKMWYIHALKYYSAPQGNEVVLGEPRKPYAKWKRPDIKVRIMCDSIYVDYPEEVSA